MKFRRQKPVAASRIDYRIEEIEAEMARVRNELKTLRQTGKRADEPTAAPPRPRPPPPRPVAAPPSTAPARDLFSHAARQEQGAPPVYDETNYRGGSGVEVDKQKFGRYFSSGSFLSSQSVGVDRRVMRNRAILMMVIVVIVAFIVYSIFH